jgi:hypothetical protein
MTATITAAIAAAQMVLACEDPIRAFLVAIARLNRQINALSCVHRRLWRRRRKRVGEFGSIARHG